MRGLRTGPHRFPDCEFAQRGQIIDAKEIVERAGESGNRLRRPVRMACRHAQRVLLCARAALIGDADMIKQADVRRIAFRGPARSSQPPKSAAEAFARQWATLLLALTTM